MFSLQQIQQYKFSHKNLVSLKFSKDGHRNKNAMLHQVQFPSDSVCIKLLMSHWMSYISALLVSSLNEPHLSSMSINLLRFKFLPKNHWITSATALIHLNSSNMLTLFCFLGTCPLGPPACFFCSTLLLLHSICSDEIQMFLDHSPVFGWNSVEQVHGAQDSGGGMETRNQKLSKCIRSVDSFQTGSPTQAPTVRSCFLRAAGCLGDPDFLFLSLEIVLWTGCIHNVVCYMYSNVSWDKIAQRLWDKTLCSDH